MRKLMIAGAAAAAAFAMPAQAYTISWTPGVNNVPAAVAGYVFRQNFDSATSGTAALSSVVLDGPASSSGSSSAFLYAGNVGGQAVIPNDGTLNSVGGFAAVQGGGLYTIDFGAGGVRMLSFFIGGLDSYNTLTLTLAGATERLVTLTGDQLRGLSTVGSESGAISGRFRIDTGTTDVITQAVFSSGQNSFEFDDLVYAVPEPATWAMMIFGFGAAGSALRFRRRASKPAVA